MRIFEASQHERGGISYLPLWKRPLLYCVETCSIDCPAKSLFIVRHNFTARKTAKCRGAFEGDSCLVLQSIIAMDNGWELQNGINSFLNWIYNIIIQTNSSIVKGKTFANEITTCKFVSILLRACRVQILCSL